MDGIESLKWEEVRTEHIVQDRWIDFRRSAYRLPDGRVSEPYYSFNRRDYVVIIASDEEGKFLCVQQYRYGIREVTMEFPAGGIERSDGKEYGTARDLFTVWPMDELLMKTYCPNGVLEEEGLLIVFTSVESCRSFLREEAGLKYGRCVEIRNIPFTDVLGVATTCKERVYVDPHDPVEVRLLGFDGTTRAIRVFELRSEHEEVTLHVAIELPGNRRFYRIRKQYSIPHEGRDILYLE